MVYRLVVSDFWTPLYVSSHHSIVFVCHDLVLRTQVFSILFIPVYLSVSQGYGFQPSYDGDELSKTVVHLHRSTKYKFRVRERCSVAESIVIHLLN